MKTATHTAATLAAMSLAQLTEVYNQHAAKPIKKFSGKKDEAIERVLAVLPKPEAKAKGVSKGTKPRTGIGAKFRELIKAGGFTRYQNIVDEVKKTFPDTKATVKDVAWHAHQMRQAGEL